MRRGRSLIVSLNNSTGGEHCCLCMQSKLIECLDLLLLQDILVHGKYEKTVIFSSRVRLTYLPGTREARKKVPESEMHNR